MNVVFHRVLIAGLLLALFGCGGSQDGLRSYSDADETLDEQPAASGAESPSQAAGERPEASPGSAEKPVEAESPGLTKGSTPEPAGPIPPVKERMATETVPSANDQPADRPPPPALPRRLGQAEPGDESTELAQDQSGGPASGSPVAIARPREPKLLIPEKTFPLVGKERVLRVSYDDIDLLKVLNMDPVPADCVKHFPDWLKNLDGARVRIRGFMYPPIREDNLPGFILARDNQICCFGRDPKVYDVFPVRLKEGTTTNYIPNRPFDVVGTFHIRPDVFRGELDNLYEIEDAEVIDE